MEAGRHIRQAPGSGGGALLCLAVLFAVVPVLSGCSLVYQTGGDVLAHYGRTEITPFMLGEDDIAMACRGGLAMTPVLGSLREHRANTGKLEIFTWSMAAMCAEQQALEQELRFHRAAHQGLHERAEDARTLQKRHSHQAAKRFYRSYLLWQEEFAEPAPGRCPAMRRDFDQLAYMVGMISGAQALMHDTVADFSLGVPRDVAGKAERAAACLDSDRWWGLPMGIRAAIWTVLPMLAPEDADPWGELARVVEQGEQAGIRLNSALYVVAAYSAGDRQRTRAALRSFADQAGNHNPDYAFLDAMAVLMDGAVSDRLWTQAVGRRTPHNRLGSFWDDPATTPLDIEGLLD